MSTPPHDDPSPLLPSGDADDPQEQLGIEVIKQAAAFGRIVEIAKALDVQPPVTEANAHEVFAAFVRQHKAARAEADAARALLRLLL